MIPIPFAWSLALSFAPTFTWSFGSAALVIAVALLAVAVVVGLAGVLTAEDDAGRAVISDLVYFAAVGMLAVFGVLVGSAVVDDAIMIASLLGVLATVSLARIITRGRR